MKTTLAAVIVLFACAISAADELPTTKPAEPAKIVYLCDASGSMQQDFDALRTQIKTAVNALKPEQLFNVIFFSDDRNKPFNKGGLVTADAENKKKLENFVDDVPPRATADAYPALELAFANKPEVIYLTTDSIDDEKEATELYELVAALEKDRKVVVNITFILREKNPNTHQMMVDTVEKISKESGGVFNLVVKE